MPLFGVKEIREFTIVAGGGGKSGYGVDCGVIVIDSKGTEIKYTTNDIIKKLEVYDLEKVDDGKEKQQGGILIAACGDNNLYLMHFINGEIKLINFLEGKVLKALLTRDLIVCMESGEIYGFRNVMEIKNLVKPDFPLDYESFVFTIVVEGEKILFYNEEGKLVTPGNSLSFFLKPKDKLYRACARNGYSMYYDEGTVTNVPGYIVDMAYRNGNLVYYYHKINKSVLVINNLNLLHPKITGMDLRKDVLSVITVTGDIITYDHGKHVSTKNVSNIPLTGLHLKNNKIVFSLLNGMVGYCYTGSGFFRNIPFVFIIFMLLLVSYFYEIFTK